MAPSAHALDVLILAAGEGKRMKSTTPKVLLDLLGRPMLAHVVRAARTLRPRKIVVIGGRHLPRIEAAFARERGLSYARQPKPLGTAHAVRFGVKALPRGRGGVLVLSGDVPLVTRATLHRLVREHRRSGASVTVLTSVVRNPAGLGRIVRDLEGGLRAIVEEKDADAATLTIREINSGIYVFERATLERLLPKVGRKNAQGEYYLTDVLGLARAAGGVVGLVAASDPGEVAGINSPAELVAARRILRRRKAFLPVSAPDTIAASTRRQERHGNQEPRDRGAHTQGKRRGPARAPRRKGAGSRLRPRR